VRKRLSGRAVAAAVLAVALALVLAAGVAWATIPDAGGVIHGCFKKLGGDLRVIDPAAGGACKSSETSLDWSQTGPQGPQGPQGAQGPQGPQGPQGLAGITQDPKPMLVTVNVQADPNIGGFSVEVDCPTGTKVLWGGWEWELFAGDKPPADIESFPFSDTSWVFAVSASNASKGAAAFVQIGCAVAR